MANHVANRLTIEGDSKEIAKMLKEIRGKAEDGSTLLIDFNKLIPMPEALNITAGSQANNALKHYTQYLNDCAAVSDMCVSNGLSENEQSELLRSLLEKYEKPDGNDSPLFRLGEQCHNNVRDYGHPTWYEWKKWNWGSKGDAFDQMQTYNNVIDFYTANTGVSPIAAALAEKYPSLSFSYMYADQDWGCNVGEFEYEGGQCVYSNIPASESDEATAIARELLGEYEWDSDEEEYEDDMEI
jgi:hypothetical protein